MALLPNRARRLSLAALILLPLVAATSVSAETKLLRYPDIHGDQVVFTYAGDLWVASTAGGAARRLTAHPGVELFAKFSPDGTHVAFTGQYDGDEQVYVVETAGGAPRQLTFYPALGPLPPRWGYDHQVYGWSPDGDGVLFRSLRDGWDIGEGHLFTVPRDGGLPERLPMPGSGAGAFSPDGERIVYSPLSRDFRHWKRYEGGWAQNLFIFDPATDSARQLTDHKRTERDPMWIGDRVYFSADWTGTLQLYGVDPAGGEFEQLTEHETWDVRWPSADESGGQIVYELAGQLQVLDLEAGSSRQLSITVPSDQLARRSSYKSVGGLISGASVAPGGKRAIFAARGDLYTVPVEHGPVRNLTRSSGARDDLPVWAPDGRHIIFVSDRTGEQEIWKIRQDGRGEPEQLTRGEATRPFGLLLSPDGSHLAFRDAEARLFVLEVDGGAVTEIADDTVKFGLGYTWSPRGGHLALTLRDSNDRRSIHIWSRADGETRRVTGELSHDYSPSFGPDGDYLYFLSDRQYQPQLGAIEFNYAHNRDTYIYALALRGDVAHPFPPRSDEAELTEDESEGDASEDAEEEGAEKGKDKKGEKEGDDGDGDGDEAPIVIDFDGLGTRIARVPAPADNYGGLRAGDGNLLYFKSGPAYYGRGSGQDTELLVYDLEKREPSTLVSDIRGAAFSSDGRHLLVREGGGFKILEAKAGAQGKPVSTSKLGTEIDPVEEWAQIFDDAWRMFRDFFYVENMHGYDWEAIRERYRPLLEHVAHRSDLNYLISEMIAELNVSHAYVAGGDLGRPERAPVALLGGRLRLDAEAGAFRIAEIFEGDNSEPNYRSPLTEIGVDVEVGDFVLAIDGRRLDAGTNPYEVLRHADMGHVELMVSETTDIDDAESVVIRPIRSEDDLIYWAWTEANRKKVAAATD
ncbi:MAG: PDZ domain-containing protein, partial [Acidobacteriota bacterium]